jgi:3-oxoacyl-[acyl-carrier protein] reductase
LHGFEFTIALSPILGSMSQLHGHVALVTGANHGIGAATAKLLAKRGASVVLSYLRFPESTEPGSTELYRKHRAQGADLVVAEIKASGGGGASIEADLADSATAARLFDFAEQAFGPVDILINNASGWIADTFSPIAQPHFSRERKQVSSETIDRVFGVDARGSALLITEFARRHAARGAAWGRIIGLTSGGRNGFPNEVSYGAAKAALENFTMSAAFELAPLGITANIVYPPVTDTGWVTDEVRAHVAQSSDLIHIAQPEEVAEVIAYLASSEAGLITGNLIHLR